MNDQEHNQDQQDIRIPVPTPPEVHTTVERGEQAIPHVVDHEHRLTSIEHKQEQDIERIEGEIATTRNELMEAMQAAKVEQAATLEQHLNELMEKLTRVEQATTVEAPQEVVSDIEQAPTDVVNVVPEVTDVKPPEKYQGLRERRKSKHGNK